MKLSIESRDFIYYRIYKIFTKEYITAHRDLIYKELEEYFENNRVSFAGFEVDVYSQIIHYIYKNDLDFSEEHIEYIRRYSLNMKNLSEISLPKIKNISKDSILDEISMIHK